MKVVFFPRSQYPIEVCTHRLGKKMTYTDGTDGVYISLSYTPYTTMAKQRGIKGSVFAEYEELNSSAIDTPLSDERAGFMWIDQYSRCPSLAAKIASGEDITEEEFIYAYNNELLPVFENAVGRKPVGLSYSRGRTSFADYAIQKYLVCRGSEPLGTQDYYQTDYGVGKGLWDDEISNRPYSFDNYKILVNTSRWYDIAKANGNNFQQQLNLLSANIDATLINGGWFRNFTHWHNYWEDGNEKWAETYLDLLASKNAYDEIYFAGYGEAVAYLVYRQMISNAVMYSPVGSETNKLVIRLEALNIFNIDTDLLQVPISIKFSTAGTPLEGQIIRCNNNLVSLGNNQYIVEIPWSEYAGVVIEKVNS